jgi:hypothetical protein
MIVINKRRNRFRVKLDVNAKYEEAAKSLRRLQIQPVGKNIASIELNNGVISLAGADGIHVPLVHGAVIEIDSKCATALKNPSGVRLGKQSDEGILWELIPGIEAVALLLDLSKGRDIVEYSKYFPIRVMRDDTIRSVDRDGKTKGEISLGVYHVKNAEGEWRTLPKDQSLKALVKEYGGDDYQDVY